MSKESSLWMGDIQPWMNRELIMNSFLEYGLKPSSIKMIRDQKYNINKNFCFINFETMAEANTALINLNGKIIPGTNIIFRLNWANRHCERNQNLYVGNLPNNIDDIQLFNIFKEKYKSVHHVSIMTDNGRSKGYGFVQFTDILDYDKCLKEMDGYILKGKNIIIRERTYKKKEEKCRDNMPYNNNSYRYNKLDIPINYRYDNRIIYNKNKYEVKNDNSILNINDNEDKDSSSSISSNIKNEKRKFSDNLDLILNDDHNILNKKIQESVEKMFEHYKYLSKDNVNDYYNMIIYYGFNRKTFSESFYF